MSDLFKQEQSTREAKVISFINMKGGVGKTTLCINVADWLSRQGKKALIIDIDPQFNATQSFFRSDDKVKEYLSYVQEGNTITKIFRANGQIYPNPREPQAEASTEIIRTISTNLDIIVGDINLIFEANTVDTSRLLKLKNFIKRNNLRQKYDIIVIDCPPTVSVYTNAAIIASDYYIIPSRLDLYSSLGITHLLGVVDQLVDDHELAIQSLGVIYTNTDSNLSPKTQVIKDTLEKSFQEKELYFFQSQFKEVRNLQVGKQGNIAANYESSKVLIEKICEEIEKRILQLEEVSNDK